MMGILDLYSKRRKREGKTAPDVYEYDEIPLTLRNQVIHIWSDAIGEPYERDAKKVFLDVAKMLRREYGVMVLSDKTYDDDDARQAYDELCFCLKKKGELFDRTETERVLDIIELTFKVIDGYTRQHSYAEYRQGNERIADRAIEELNARFKEAGVGYFYSGGIIGRIDSEIAHAEIVKPALKVLREKKYASAEKEFLDAHENFRLGNNADVLIDCLKAFESTMKIICDTRGWQYDSTKGASELVRVCLANNLIPAYWQTHFAGLRSVLESAIPTPRNKEAGHGAGTKAPHNPPNELVAYVLHLTAATILFLTEAEKAVP